jgi:putative thioredoxin
MHLFGSAATKPASQPKGNGAAVKDTRLETFAQDVIQASMTTPVLVDFWAPWCGPCKQLQPLLEKVVKQAAGKVKLVKVNIDEEPELAQQLRIQSVPTVYAFVGGQPVTGFVGAQPESQIKALVDRLVGGDAGAGDIAADLAEAKAAAAAGDAQTAAAIFNAILQDEPTNADAIAGLARLLLGAGRLDDAKAWLDKAPKEAASHAEIVGARAALQLALESGELGDPAALEARLAREEGDHDARYRLATLLFLRGQAEAAMEQLCRIVKRDRGWQDDKARKQLVRFFEALGAKHPATLKGRRMLSAVLFS